MESQSHWVNNFWGEDDAGYHRLMQRMHHAKQTSEEVKSFYSERYAIEQEYAKRLMALSKRPLGSNETGGMKASLDSVRSTTETMATTHETVARQLNEQLLAPLEAFAVSMRDRRKTVEDTMGKLTKAKTSQNNAAEKARSRYRAECNKISGFNAQQNLLMGKELERNNQKLEKSMYQVEGLQRQYQDLLKALAQSMETWNAEWRVSCDRLEHIEEERLSFMKSNLWAYANAVSAACVADDEGCEAIRVSLEQCDPVHDLEHFASKHGTGARIQDPPEFVNFLHGFSRDSEDDAGHYHVANFDSANMTASQLEDVPDLTAPSGSRSGPELSPRSTASSQFSPGSPGSQYSGGTSVTSGASPTMPAEFETKQEKNVQKRRSWAMPFKRQSQPDTSQLKPGRFDIGDKPAEPAAQAIAPPQAISEPRTQTTTQSTRAQAPSQRQEARHSYAAPASGAGYEEDPLLVALERLKAPSAAKPRPKSMPGYNVGNGGPSSPYGNGHATAAPSHSPTSSPPKRRPVNRKQVSSEYEPAAPDSLPRGYHPSQASGQAYGQYGQAQHPQYAHPQYAQQQYPNYTQQPQQRPTQAAPYPQRYSQKPAAPMAVPQHHQQQLPSRTSDGRPVVKHSRARYDYRAAIPEEVTFRKGDVLLITEMQDDGWWDCEVYGRGEFGLAPSNFLADA